MPEGFLAHRAGGDHHVGVRLGEDLQGLVADLRLLVEGEHRVAEVHAAADAVFLLCGDLFQLTDGLQHFAGLLVDAAAASEVARVVVSERCIHLFHRKFAGLDQHVEVLGVVIDGDVEVVFVLEGVVADGAGGDEGGGV